jgi:hypothetical protein
VGGAEKAGCDITLLSVLARVLGVVVRVVVVLVFLLVLAFFQFGTFPSKLACDRLWETGRPSNLRVGALHKCKGIDKNSGVISAVVGWHDRVAPRTFGRLSGIFPISVVDLVVITQLEVDRLLFCRTGMWSFGDQRFLPDSRVIPAQGRSRIVSLHRRSGGVIIDGIIPTNMSTFFGACYRSCGRRLLALMMTPGSFGTNLSKLESLEFAQVFSDGGVSVVIAVTANNMGAVCLVMHGRLLRVRLRQVIRVGARDDCMRGYRTAAETGALDGGRGGIGGRHCKE